MSQHTEIADAGTFQPLDLDLQSRDPLGFDGYETMLQRARDRSGLDESLTAGAAEIGGHRVELAIFDFSFMGGSMGEVAGERLARSLERAGQRGVPFVLRTATGGARMQEGMRSLIQMPKVVAARRALAEAHQPFVVLLGHPTTGGVLASVGALADVTLAERGATIGFAGPRVAERVTGVPVTEGSHTAESALEQGLVDEILDPSETPVRIAAVLRCLAPGTPTPCPAAPPEAVAAASRDPWETVQRARAPKGLALAEIFDDVVPLNGDRAGKAATELRSLLVKVDGRRGLLLDTAGHPLWPASLRKALRCLDVAERLQLPVVTFIDTPGADPSAGSEREGIAWLIAALSDRMLSLSVPIVAVVTGEGGSGGALAFATGDALVAFESSVFSVIGPEAAAEILWRDASRGPEAAGLLRLTASDLRDLRIADSVVKGQPTPELLRQVVSYHLAQIDRPGAERSATRRQRWRDTW